MLSRQYLNIHYLWPLLAVLLFVCLPTDVCFNIADHQTCCPLGGFCDIFLQDIHVLAFHKPNGWKIIIDQIKRVLARPSSHYSKYPWSFFFFMWNLVVQDVVAILIYIFFIYTIFFFINLKVLCVNVIDRNAQVLDEELNLLWPGFLGMVFHMLLAFRIKFD